MYKYQLKTWKVLSILSLMNLAQFFFFFFFFFFLGGGGFTPSQ